jgi:hypothetical protein
MAMVMESSRAFETRAMPAAGGKLIAWTVFAAVLVVIAICAVATSSPPALDPAAMALVAP